MTPVARPHAAPLDASTAAVTPAIPRSLRLRASMMPTFTDTNPWMSRVRARATPSTGCTSVTIGSSRSPVFVPHRNDPAPPKIDFMALRPSL